MLQWKLCPEFCLAGLSVWAADVCWRWCDGFVWVEQSESVYGVCWPVGWLGLKPLSRGEVCVGVCGSMMACSTSGAAAVFRRWLLHMWKHTPTWSRSRTNLSCPAHPSSAPAQTESMWGLCQPAGLGPNPAEEGRRGQRLFAGPMSWCSKIGVKYSSSWMFAPYYAFKMSGKEWGWCSLQPSFTVCHVGVSQWDESAQYCFC